MRIRSVAAGVVAVGVLASGCSVGETPVSPSATNPATPSAVESPLASSDVSASARATSWGPSARDWARAGDVVAAMSTAEQAGQVIVAAYSGLEPPVAMVRELGLGGVILMGDNVPVGPGSAEALAQVTTRLQQARSARHPLVVAVDQEGGPVARVGPPATAFPAGMAHGAANSVVITRAAAQASGRELAALGITMSMAPVADVTVGPSDPTIGVRSPGDRPPLVARVATAAARGLLQGGVVPVVKHFPGHGSVPADSHEQLPVQTASLAQLERRDLVPFVRAVQAGLPAVMIAHIDVRAIDPGVPASLSPAVVTGLLRERLGFDGVVVTDSLGMAAVTQRYSSEQAAVLALGAGADMLLMPPDPEAARDGIVAAVDAGRLPPQRLAQAARRVVALALYQERRVDVRPALSAVGSSHEQSGALSAAAVTLVEGPCAGPYVGGAVRVTGGSETDRLLFDQAARDAGLTTGSGDLVTLLSSSTPGSGDVVVALDTPYALAGSSATTASLALFGRTPQAFEALVDVLTGRAPAPGRLPVSVEGLAPRRC